MCPCPCCGQKIPIGQAKLTDREIQRLPMGNQFNDDLTLIEWQCIKGAAVYYDVTDWVSEVDTSLSYEENMSKMETSGTNVKRSSGATVKELAAKERQRMRMR